jgi:KDO2-lipid IV(A) lauroyltransferase
VREGKRPSEHKSWFTRQQRRWRNARRWLLAQLVRPVLLGVQRLPFGAQRRLLRGLLRLAGRLRLERKADRILQRAYGDELSVARRAEIVRQVLRNMADVAAETITFSRQGKRFFASRIDLDDARARFAELGRRVRGGLIALTGHLGNWELLAQLGHASYDRPVGIIVKRIPNPHLNRILDRFRTAHGLRTFSRQDSPAGALRLLHRGGMLGIAADQDSKDVGGLFVEFFGQPAYTPIGPARLAWTASVPIVLTALLREGDRFELFFGEPIWPDRSRPRDEELLRLTSEWTRQLESLVRAHPEQWIWWHNRWRTTPERVDHRQRRARGSGGDSDDDDAVA